MKSKDGKVGFYIPSTFLSSKQLAGIALLKRCGVGRKDIAYIVPGGTLCIIDKAA